ncbi:CCA tRNA nucleotidyltransferase [Thermovenabulum sp.]|uniref:CCA tRNA nucleotidyltransferase n=1 Tax=Thermovenabulum sp. TaxID=3100335 RepID=UPI003C7BC41C
MLSQIKIPQDVIEVIKCFKNSGYQAYIVGGTVRDALLGKENFDYDISTSARPYEIQKALPKAIPYGEFGTFLYVLKDKKIEITPFRNDAPGRKPQYGFAGSIEEDLSRRDFTINSIAYDPIENKIIDPFGGIEDIKNKIIRCTGSSKRIWEDPLRALRAVRFMAQLNFSIEPSTLYTIKAKSALLETISKERIRDEFSKILLSDNSYEGLNMLFLTNLLDYIIPELLEGMGVEHYNKPYDVLEHNLIMSKYLSKKLYLKLAGVLHDVGKPFCAQKKEYGLEFPNHHEISARIAEEVLRRLKYDSKTIKKVIHLIKHHMFIFYPEDDLYKARKLVFTVGWENIYDLIEIRKADRLASGFPQAIGPGLSSLINKLEILQKEKLDYNLKDLAVKGDDLIKAFNLKPGPLIGQILSYLLEEILKDPSLNEKDTLLEMAKNKFYPKKEEM